MEKICKNCTKVFEAKNKRAQFCSDSCRVSFWQQHNRVQKATKKDNEKEAGQLDGERIKVKGEIYILESAHLKILEKRTTRLVVLCFLIVLISIIIIII